MGLIRGAIRAARVANKVRKVKKSGAGKEQIARTVGQGARKIVRSGLPFATGIIVDKIAGDAIEKKATEIAGRGLDKGRNIAHNMGAGQQWDAFMGGSSETGGGSTPPPKRGALDDEDWKSEW